LFTKERAARQLKYLFALQLKDKVHRVDEGVSACRCETSVLLCFYSWWSFTPLKQTMLCRNRYAENNWAQWSGITSLIILLQYFRKVFTFSFYLL